MLKQEAEALIDAKVAALKNTVVRKGEFSTAEAAAREINIVEIHKNASKDEKTVNFQKASDDLYLTSLVLNKPMKECKLYKSYRAMLNQDSELAKAMSAGGSNVGAEWVPNGYSSQLTEMVQIERKLAAMFPSFQMTQNPYIWPISTGFATTYLIGENTNITASDDPTNKVTFTATKQACRIDASYELDEDSIVAVIPALKKNIAESLARAEENTLINGCADNTVDTDNSTGTDHRRAFVGLRKLAIANSYTTDCSSFYGDTIGPMRKELGKYYEPNKCVWVAGTSVWEQLSRLKSDNTKQYPLVITADKAGGLGATMATGVLGTMFGSPIVRSEFMRETQASNGTDPGNDTKCSLILVRLDAFKLGYRGGITAETFRLVTSQTTQIVSTQRIAFMPMQAIASNHVVELGINIAA